MARRATVHGGLADLASLRHGLVGSDVRHYLPCPQIADEGVHVGELVRAQRDPVPAKAAVELHLASLR